MRWRDNNPPARSAASTQPDPRRLLVWHGPPVRQQGAPSRHQPAQPWYVAEVDDIGAGPHPVDRVLAREGTPARRRHLEGEQHERDEGAGRRGKVGAPRPGDVERHREDQGEQEREAQALVLEGEGAPGVGRGPQGQREEQQQGKAQVPAGRLPSLGRGLGSRCIHRSPPSRLLRALRPGNPPGRTRRSSASPVSAIASWSTIYGTTDVRRCRFRLSAPQGRQTASGRAPPG